MSAFMIIEVDITDMARFARYAEVTLALVEQFGGKYRVLKGSRKCLEGDWGMTKVVISEWPSMAAAEIFWQSAEYAEVKKLREGAAQVRILLAEAVPMT